MTFTADVLGIQGEQIEQGQHAEADGRGEHHWAEDAVRRQVGRDAAADVEEKHHAPPQQEGGDAEQVDEGAGAGHGEAGIEN